MATTNSVYSLTYYRPPQGAKENDYENQNKDQASIHTRSADTRMGKPHEKRRAICVINSNGTPL